MTNQPSDDIGTISSIDQPEHFVNRSVPVLFSSRRGLQLRKFHSVLNTGQASYTVQFCDLERWVSFSAGRRINCKSVKLWHFMITVQQL